MSPKERKKARKCYRKQRKKIIKKTLSLEDEEYASFINMGELLCRYTDLVQGDREKKPIDKESEQIYIGSLLSIFAIYGNLSQNPMEKALYALSLSLKDMKQ